MELFEVLGNHIKGWMDMKPRSTEPITTEPTEKMYTQDEVDKQINQRLEQRDMVWMKRISELADNAANTNRRDHWETIVEVLIDGHTPTTDAEYQALHASKVALFADKMLEEWDKRWDKPKESKTP